MFLSFALITLSVIIMTFLIPGESLSSIKHAPIHLVLAGFVQIIAVRANMYAFRHEELSYITPMFALTPLYATVIAYFTLGETPSTLGLIGILAIVSGVYTVTSTKDIGIKDTVKHVFNNKGARAGMLIPMAYSVSAIFNKGAINQGVTPVASVVLITAVMCIAHMYVLIKNRQEVIDTITNKPLLRLILLVSVFGIGSVVFASLALTDAPTSYVLSIRRLDIIITVIIGWKFMGDSNFTRRITGSLIVFAGVVMIGFS